MENSLLFVEWPYTFDYILTPKIYINKTLYDASTSFYDNFMPLERLEYS